MNFIFKILLILFLPLSVFSRDIILISFKSYPDKAKMAQKILLDKFSFPQSIISLEKRYVPCAVEKDAAFHICIDESGEMIVLKRDEELAKKSLSIFSKETKAEDYE